jgi:hypothetical protein
MNSYRGHSPQRWQEQIHLKDMLQKQAALQAAMNAHLAYLAALDAHEELYVAPGAISESLGHLVATLADAPLTAGSGGHALVDASTSPSWMVSLNSCREICAFSKYTKIFSIKGGVLVDILPFHAILLSIG